jgi:hypothetical protein
MTTRSNIKPQIVPEFVEMPRAGARCPYTTLTRWAYDILARPQPANNFKPPVPSRMFSQEGTKRARRLIHYPSLIRYLHSLPSGTDVDTIVPRGKHIK